MTKTPQSKLEELKASQSLQTKTLNNARELGGYVMRDGRQIRRGKLLRSFFLAEATEEDIRILRETYDLRLVLDMRSEDEIEQEPDPEIPGVRWVHVPIIDFEELQDNQEEVDWSSPESVVKETARFLQEGDAEKAYAHDLESSFGQAGFRAFFREILNCTDGAALWHCHTGKDRTGIGAGLLLEVLGAEWDTILADYELSSLFFAEGIREAEKLARSMGYDEEMVEKISGLTDGVHAGFLENAWDYLRESWGSPVGYVTNALGITEREIEILRERYLE